jgi:4'-phosphopantetheinyl transferase
VIATLYSTTGAALADGDVHVWQFSCRQDVGRYGMLLSPDERQAAARFVAATHRDAYVVQHAMVRLLLARYLDRDPSALAFARGPHGKPRIDGIEHNLSHATDVAVLAVARRVALGIDIERLDARIDPETLGRRVLASDEDAPDLASFLRIWCRKEAVLKATGVDQADAGRLESRARTRSCSGARDHDRDRLDRAHAGRRARAPVITCSRT